MTGGQGIGRPVNWAKYGGCEIVPLQGADKLCPMQGRESCYEVRIVQFRETFVYTRAGTLIGATIYLQLIQNRYMFPSFTVLQCSHQHCVQPVASDVEVVGYL